MAHIITTFGKVKDISPKNGETFSLEELRSIVNGHIEIVRLSNEKYLVCNEEGKLLGLPINHLATQLLDNEDYVVGNVLICNVNQIN